MTIVYVKISKSFPLIRIETFSFLKQKKRERGKKKKEGKREGGERKAI